MPAGVIDHNMGDIVAGGDRFLGNQPHTIGRESPSPVGMLMGGK